MKETIKINLSQRLFDLDADAYDLLKQYLDDLKRIFEKSPEEAEEILHDIEQRMADLLEEKLDSSKQVVTKKDIEDIIQKLGTAEDFARENAESESGNDDPLNDEYVHSGSSFHRAHRRFYRDLENNIIGGVCSGLGAYFNIDPVWIRVTLLLLFFLKGFGLLIYLILWAVVPAARTTAQKLQMKGRPVTVENIHDSVKREFNKVKDNFSRYSESEGYKRTQNTIADIFRGIGNIFMLILKIVLTLIGVGIIIAGVFLIIALVSSLAGGALFHGFQWHFPLTWHFPHINVENITLFTVALLLVVLIPVIAILIGITKVIFGVRSRNHVLAAFAWTFWALSLVFILITIFTGNALFSYQSGYINEKEINLPENKVLYIELDPNRQRLRNTAHYSVFGREIIHDKFYDKCYLKPLINLQNSDRDEMYIMVEYRTIFPDFDEDYSAEIDYYWELDDSLLLLNEYFAVDEDDIWKGPVVNITLFFPEGQKFQISRNMKKMIDKSQEQNILYDDLYDRKLQLRDHEVEIAE